MKKRIWIIPVIVILVCGFFIGRSFIGTRPFKDLTAKDVKEVTVKLIPPDTELGFTDEEVNKLVEILNRVVIYQKDNSYGKYAGQAVIFTMTKTDGTQISINAYNPFIIIDGVGYKTKYGPCEELNNLANNLEAEK
ncbi:hypothetical protein [Anaerocolumna jejuensis]|uniref:hypothetical protein n=1 Tax=Anaerocolumna jejuensis TaxID=259063 RepID=UPI003F7C408B